MKLGAGHDGLMVGSNGELS